MPNHIKNRLAIHGRQEEVEAFFVAVGSDHDAIDFEKIIPPPSNIFRDDLSFEKEAELDASGIPHWYRWNRENWGTKWNAYSTERKDNLLLFETAWSHPKPIVSKIAEMFPLLTIYWDYADEDTGCNVGQYILRDGKSFYHAIENQSIEAYELAFSLRPEDRESYSIVDGKYEYIEE